MTEESKVECFKAVLYTVCVQFLLVNTPSPEWSKYIRICCGMHSPVARLLRTQFWNGRKILNRQHGVFEEDQLHILLEMKFVVYNENNRYLTP